MLGAVIGDINGSPFEFDRGNKTKDFELFTEDMHFTDDTVMTVAVAEALVNAGPEADIETIRRETIASMQKWGRKYPFAGYGGRFRSWLKAKNPRPYGSWGNGSAMRVSAVGHLYTTLERTREVARATAEVTHDHPEGIKGAEATASVIFLARTGKKPDEIRDYVTREFGYDLSRTCDEIRPGYHHVESCQETVPEAIIAFLEGENFEDVLRNAVSLGGDTDTLAAIACSMAEAMYFIPEDWREETLRRLPAEMIAVFDRFECMTEPVNPRANRRLEAAVGTYADDPTDEHHAALFEIMTHRCRENAQFSVPVRFETEPFRVFIRRITDRDGRTWIPAWTLREQSIRACGGSVLAEMPMSALMEHVLETEEDGTDGILLNAGSPHQLWFTAETIRKILQACKNEKEET